MKEKPPLQDLKLKIDAYVNKDTGAARLKQIVENAGKLERSEKDALVSHTLDLSGNAFQEFLFFLKKTNLKSEIEYLSDGNNGNCNGKNGNGKAAAESEMGDGKRIDYKKSDWRLAPEKKKENFKSIMELLGKLQRAERVLYHLTPEKEIAHSRDRDQTRFINGLARLL